MFYVLSTEPDFSVVGRGFGLRDMWSQNHFSKGRKISSSEPWMVLALEKGRSGNKPTAGTDDPESEARIRRGDSQLAFGMGERNHTANYTQKGTDRSWRGCNY